MANMIGYYNIDKCKGQTFIVFLHKMEKTCFSPEYQHANCDAGIPALIQFELHCL